MKTLRSQVLSTMDKLGIIGQPGYPKEWNDGIDGGDSINRMAHYHFLIEANNYIGNNIAELANLPFRTKEDYVELLKIFQCPNSPGNYRRHPTNDWSAYCNGTYDGNMSRDQTHPLLISMAFIGLYGHLFMYFLRHLMRVLLFTNNTRNNGSTADNHGEKFNPNAPELTRFQKFVLDHKIPIIPTPKGYRNHAWKLPDLTLIEIFSTYLRAHPVIGYLLYPVLCLLDLELLFSAWLWKKRGDDDDIIQFASSLIFSNIRVRTPVSYLATKLIKKEFIIDRLTSYWCGWRKGCFFVNLYEPLLDKIFK